jgi:hypothetical protein
VEERVGVRRLSQNSKFASKIFEKHYRNILTQNQNASYRKCGRSFVDRLLGFRVLRQFLRRLHSRFDPLSLSLSPLRGARRRHPTIFEISAKK